MGPLEGVKIVELGGVGPGPFCGMLLSDMGAEVLRIDRMAPSDSGVSMEPKFNVLHRGRLSVAVDLKRPQAVDAVKRLVAQADAAFEGFRPGVMEKVGLGPQDCMAVNPRLVYGRITGWGQDGPLAQQPGHDLNYIALTGALHAIGSNGGPPVPPLNLVGDFGGGGMYLAFGMVCALHECLRSGKGQVVDAAMVDGAASLMALMYGLRAGGHWRDERGSNRLDSGAPWYSVYETKDGHFVSLASLEPRFYRETLRVMELDSLGLDDLQHDQANWPRMREQFARKFREKTRDEWCATMEGTEVCFAPVLSMADAPAHPHMAARGTFVEMGGVVQPAPAPRFSRTLPEIRHGAPRPGQDTDGALQAWGFSASDVEALRQCGAVA